MAVLHASLGNISAAQPGTAGPNKAYPVPTPEYLGPERGRMIQRMCSVRGCVWEESSYNRDLLTIK